MEKFHTSIVINASPEKVWNIMLGKDTYPQWTKAFNPASQYEGSWEQGSKIHFIGVDERGNNMGGMVSRIAESRPHDFVSVEHLGIVLPDGAEDTTSEEARKWSPAFENYTFTARDGGTELSIDQDIGAEYKEEFKKMWPEALKALKELAEQ